MIGTKPKRPPPPPLSYVLRTKTMRTEYKGTHAEGIALLFVAMSPEAQYETLEGLTRLYHSNPSASNVNESRDRTISLLRAAGDLLQKQSDSANVLSVLDETAFYDGADCDGRCLLGDIISHLEDIAP